MSSSYPVGSHPDLPPRSNSAGLVKWIKDNLFSSFSNIIVTLTIAYFLYKIIPSAFHWIFFDSVFNAADRNECRVLGDGACWAFVGERLNLFIYGFYPAEEHWRVDLFFILLVAAIVPVLFENIPLRKPVLLYSATYPLIGGWILTGGTFHLFQVVWLVVGVVIFFSLRKNQFPHRPFGMPTWLLLTIFGFIWLFALTVVDGLGVALGISREFGLASVPTYKFGGFMLTVVIGVTGIVFSLPIGILLALGRQSNLPVIYFFSVSFIEFFRGVPLITLLFVASTMLNYFLPKGTNFDLLLRVLIMVTLFSSAYMAEVIRGGLQAISRGQFEAADAMGLKYWQSMRLIVLPQALKISIPGIVNTFIGLYKDTTLVLIIGMLDPLGIGRSSLSDTKWTGLANEVYLFVAVFFFISCFAMSRYSIYLEKKLKTDHT